MKLLAITLSLIASTAMAAPQAPTEPTINGDSFANAAEEMKEIFSVQGFGINQPFLMWETSCQQKSWNARYQFVCKKFGVAYFASSWTKDISYYDFQGPKIRIGNEEVNPCAKLGGTIEVIRYRAGIREDITEKVLNFDGKSKYDGKESVFWDKYKMDCQKKI